MSHRDPNEDPLLEGAGRPHLSGVVERVGGGDSIAAARQRLEAHMDNSPLAVIEFDAQFRIVRWSGGAQRLFGWSAAEVLGHAVSDFRWVHEDDSDSVRGLIADMLSGACSRNMHVNRNYRKDGGVAYCEWYNSVIYDDNGRLASIFSQVLDITERKRSEEALRHQVELNWYYLDTVQTVIVALDGTGRITMINRKGREILGYTEAELLGRDWFETCLPQPEGTDLVYPAFRRIMSGEEELFEYFENSIRCRDGLLRLIAWHNACLKDTAGRITGILSSGEDITARRRAEEALREADRRKDEFLAILAHELRNPLAPIRNAVEILKLEDAPDATSRRARDLIERQLQHLVRLVDDLMDRNRITLGRLQLRREKLDLVQVLEQSIESARHNLQCEERVLTGELPSEPIYLDADLVRLEQVFLNLLDNACKYSGRGGRIRLTAERDGTDALVKVTDTGIGISPAQLPRLFEMFAQVETESARSRGGLGIGLAIAQKLVEMHGGRIEARSEGPGKGAEFLVRLPIIDEVCEPPPAPPLERDDDPPTAVRRILVVDDNQDVAESLALLLRVSGYEVETAHDGLEAVELAARTRPDLVFLDIGMPGMDGFAACRSMRAHPWGKDLAIFAMTGWGQEEDHLKTREAGFSGHLVKPVDQAVLERLLADPGANQG